MKRKGYLIEQVADMDNLRLAFHKAQRGKNDKAEIITYREGLERNLLHLRAQLLEGKAEVGDYKLFKIYDPKERTVCAAAFNERVLHHAMMNICGPYFERQMIATTFANREGKGAYKALELAHRSMGQYRYVAKLDVRKYFDSISHKVLKKQLLKIYKDKQLLDLWGAIIESYYVTDGRGLPIGNLTSQYLANYYLSGLDHYAKEQLKIPVYIRYMDDILLMENDLQVLKNVVEKIERYAEENLQVVMKEPILQRTSERMDFLGYNLCGRRISLSHRSKRRFESKYRYATKQLVMGMWTETEYLAHIIPLMAFVQHGYTKQYRKNIIGERHRVLTA